MLKIYYTNKCFSYFDTYFLELNMKYESASVRYLNLFNHHLGVS